MILIESHTYLDAWRRAVSFLRLEAPRLNLTLNIQAPTAHLQPMDIDLWIADHLGGTLSAADVKENTFPWAHYQLHGLDGVYRVYPDQTYPKMRRKGGWGTYAYRMLRTDDGANPLQYLITKLQSELAYKGGKRACFELNIYDNARDAGYRMGAPCLVHLSFKLIKGAVHLTALFRSHEYPARAFLNLRSLGYLMQFVSDQTGASAGTLTVISTLATLSVSHRIASEGMKLANLEGQPK